MAAVDFGSVMLDRAVPEGVPGPDMAAALDALKLGALSDAELVEVMVAWRRVSSWAQSCELAAVAELVHRREQQHQSGPPVQVAEFIADEIAVELTLSGGAAGMWAGLACKLAERLPLTRQALAEGRIDLGRAQVIADGLLGVDPGTAALVEQAVIDAAQQMPKARLRHRVREAIKAVDPEAAEQRRQRARKVRSLEKWATAAGTCELALREVSEEDAEAIYNRINAVAQAMKTDGDVRPIDAIRHDLGVALLRGTPLPEAAQDLRHADHDTITTMERPSSGFPGAGRSTTGRPAAGHGDAERPSSGFPGAGCPASGRPAAGHADAECLTAGRPAADHGTTERPTAEQPNADPGSSSAGRKGSDGRADSADLGDDLRRQAPTGPCPPGASSAREAHGHAEPDRLGEALGPGGVGGYREGCGDAVAQAAARITEMLAKVIDERLHSVADRHRTSGRRTGQALRVAAAVGTMSSALADLKQRWCETTTGQVTGGTAEVPGQAGQHDHHDQSHHGHHGYRPPAGMRRLIERTHQVCAFPTCDRPAPRCDLDHTIAWHQGGPTCACNLSPLCRRHHRLKQHPQWHLFQPWPGLLIWVTPAGTWHTIIPESRQ